MKSSKKMYFFLPQRAQQTQRKSGTEEIYSFIAVRLCVSCALSVYICQEVLGVGKK